MKLYYTTRSPYARKVLLTALKTGVYDSIDLIEINLMEKPAEFTSANPIGRIPALIDENGQVYYDSNAICTFLEAHGNKTVSKTITSENLVSLCDGLMDITVDLFKETLRPKERQSDTQLTKLKANIRHCLTYLETIITDFDQTLSPHAISLICALDYLTFRFPELGPDKSHPRLTQWKTEMAKNEAVHKTVPK